MTEDQATGLNIFRLVWRRKKFIISTVFIASLIAVVISLILPKWYKATSVIMPPSQGSSALGDLGIFGNISMGDIFGGGDNQFRLLSILKSRSLKESVAIKYDLQNRYECENMEETIKQLDKNSIIAVGDEMQVSITIYDKNQELVADITNYVVYCLDSLNISMASSKARDIRIFISQRVNEVIDSLITLEKDISYYMTNHGILSLEDQVIAGVTNAAQLKYEIILKEIELAVVEKTFESKNPEVKLREKELESLEQSYKDYFGDQAQDKLFLNFTKVPEFGIQIQRFERQVDYYLKVLEFLGPQYEKAKVDEAKDVPTIQTLDEAIRPERKARPKRAKIVLITFFVTTIFSIYAAYFLEKWNTLRK
ncbi:MAG: hypothetical protein ISS81_06640 [Candidatus Marinimicrobia bacterium]|nr:hypothetical protein [Candidatus Neomarinimicrobiota bacterium]